MTLTPYSVESPLQQVQREQTLEYFDASKAHDTMAQLCCSHELKLANPSAVHFRLSHSKLSSILLSQIEYGTEARIEYKDIGDYYTLSLPICGTQELRLGDQVTASDSCHGIIISPSKQVCLDMSSDCKKRLVQISRSAVENKLTTLLGRAVTQPVVFSTAMDANSGTGACWWRAIKHLEVEQGYAQSLYTAGPFLEQMEQMLISGLLYGQPHNYSEYLHRNENPDEPQHLHRAEVFMQASALDSISIEQIAQAAGVSRRTLYYSFKRFRCCTPIAYLRSIRMTGAREDLQNGSCDLDINDIAVKWGFTQWKFFTYYNNRFGETPLETLKR